MELSEVVKINLVKKIEKSETFGTIEFYEILYNRNLFGKNL